jgi:hypothetical protein
VACGKSLYEIEGETGEVISTTVKTIRYGMTQVRLPTCQEGRKLIVKSDVSGGCPGRFTFPYDSTGGISQSLQVAKRMSPKLADSWS